MVDIHLNIPESRDPFISIPNSDVRRLSKRPFKWLRFVMFCICGARGDLSATPDGPPVDYDSTSFSDVYYYNPSGKFSYCMRDHCSPRSLFAPPGSCIFVDYAGLNDQTTSTSQTPRRYNFREDVEERDGEVCIITQQGGCDAAHLVPNSKGDEVTLVIFLCDPSITICSSTWTGLSTTVPPFIALHLRFLGSTTFRMECS